MEVVGFSHQQQQQQQQQQQLVSDSRGSSLAACSMIPSAAANSVVDNTQDLYFTSGLSSSQVQNDDNQAALRFLKVEDCWNDNNATTTGSCLAAYSRLMRYIIHRVDIVEDGEDLIKCITKIDQRTRLELLPLVESLQDPNYKAVCELGGNKEDQIRDKAEPPDFADSVFQSHLTNFAFFLFCNTEWVDKVCNALKVFRNQEEELAKKLDVLKEGGSTELKDSVPATVTPTKDGSLLAQANGLLNPKETTTGAVTFWRALAHLHAFSSISCVNETSSSIIVPLLMKIRGILLNLEVLVKSATRFHSLAPCMVLRCISVWVPWLRWKHVDCEISQDILNGMQIIEGWCKTEALDLVDVAAVWVLAQQSQAVKVNLTKPQQTLSEFDMGTYNHLLGSFTDILSHPVLPAYVLANRPGTVHLMLCVSCSMFESPLVKASSGTPGLLKLTHSMLFMFIKLLHAEDELCNGADQALNASACEEGSSAMVSYVLRPMNATEGISSGDLVKPITPNSNTLCLMLCRALFASCAEPSADQLGITKEVRNDHRLLRSSHQRGGKYFPETLDTSRGVEASGASQERNFFWSPPEKLVWWLILHNCFEKGDPMNVPNLLKVLSKSYESLRAKCIAKFGEPDGMAVLNNKHVENSGDVQQRDEQSSAKQSTSATSVQPLCKDDQLRPPENRVRKPGIWSRQFCFSCNTEVLVAENAKNSAPLEQLTGCEGEWHRSKEVQTTTEDDEDFLPYELITLLQHIWILNANLKLKETVNISPCHYNNNNAQQPTKSGVRGQKKLDLTPTGVSGSESQTNLDELVRGIMNVGERGSTGVLSGCRQKKSGDKKKGKLGDKGGRVLSTPTGYAPTICGEEDKQSIMGKLSEDSCGASPWGYEKLGWVFRSGLQYPWAFRAVLEGGLSSGTPQSTTLPGTICASLASTPKDSGMYSQGEHENGENEELPGKNVVSGSRNYVGKKKKGKVQNRLNGANSMSDSLNGSKGDSVEGEKYHAEGIEPQGHPERLWSPSTSMETCDKHSNVRSHITTIPNVQDRYSNGEAGEPCECEKCHCVTFCSSECMEFALPLHECVCSSLAALASRR